MRAGAPLLDVWWPLKAMVAWCAMVEEVGPPAKTNWLRDSVLEVGAGAVAPTECESKLWEEACASTIGPAND